MAHRTALGTRIHQPKEEDFGAVVAASLAELALPAELLEAAHPTAYDDEVARSHEAGKDPEQDAYVGTSTIHVDGTVRFGPVPNAISRGEKAAELFDSLRVLANHEGLFERKRARSGGLSYG